MITVTDARTGTVLGTLSEDQLQQLSDHLEEEWSGDQDYYINQATVEMLQAAGVSSETTNLLARAIAGTGEADIRWSRS